MWEWWGRGPAFQLLVRHLDEPNDPDEPKVGMLVMLTLSSPVRHHPLALIPWDLSLLPAVTGILVRPVTRSLPLHVSSRSFQMIPVLALWMSWREFSLSVASMLSQTYTTTSSTFFSPQSAPEVFHRLEALLKNPGATTDVSPCILFAFVFFFRALRTHLVGVR